MSEEFNTQQAIEAFRAEMQIDRIAVQTTINDGFQRLADTFVEHADQDRKMFSDHEARIGDIERVKRLVYRLSAGAAGTIATGLIGWAITKLG